MRLITTLVVLYLCCGGLAGARTLDEIRRTGELRICVAGSSASFYRTNAEAFARFIGVQPAVVALKEWDEQFHDASGTTVKDAKYEARLLASGSCDLYPNDLHMLDWRRTKMRLVPYYTTRKVVVASRELRNVLKSTADLAGRMAAVQKGTAYESWLREENGRTFRDRPVTIREQTTAESMKLVSEKAVDFTVVGAEGAFKWVRGDTGNLALLFPVDDSVEVGWAVSFAATDLQSALERFFEQSYSVGSDMDVAWQAMYGISLMEYRLYESSFNAGGHDLRAMLRWAVPIGLALLIVIVVVVAWNRRLNHVIAGHQRAEEELLRSREQLKRESERSQAIARISLRLQECASLEAMARTLLMELARELSLGQAIFCVRDEDAGGLRAVAHFAGGAPTPAGSLEQFSMSGSLIERFLRDGQLIRIDDPGAGYVRIRSGLGECAPATIVMYPVRHREQLRAMIEIATLDPLTDDDMRLLEALEPIVALGIDMFGERAPASVLPAEPRPAG